MRFATRMIREIVSAFPAKNSFHVFILPVYEVYMGDSFLYIQQ